MASTDEYRRLAADCLRIAHESHNPKDRALLLRMAESWIRLAERAEVRKSEGEIFSGRERSEAADHRIPDAGVPDERGTNGS